MLLQIIAGTPAWVFVLFAGLLWLGGVQMFTRSVKLARVVGIGAGLTAFSLYGAMSAFAHQPLALAAWPVGAALAFSLVLTRGVPHGTRWQAATRRFDVPGSVVPLALMMGIFFIKYGVAVATSMHLPVTQHFAFALGCSALYGLASGVFAGRAARLWRLVQSPQGSAVPQVVSA